MKELWQKLTAYGEELEQVEVFKYLGRLILYDDNDVQAMRNKLMKAQKCWSRISHVLCTENTSPHVYGLFYNATVKTVIQY